MIWINCDIRNRKISVKGHARSGEPGKDLVCSAVSILVHTMAHNLLVYEKAGACTDVYVRLEKGDAEFSFSIVKEQEDYVEISLTSVATGFFLLADDYPEFVTFHGSI
jgi:uncharacterized protein YsxB (DUF464 family)